MKYLSLLFFITLLYCAGPQGPQGSAGTSVVSAIFPDTTGTCANGGNVLVVASDVLNLGYWSPQDPNQSVAFICNGSSGTNATPVTTVQLCPGTPTYPSTFVEYGVCIGGNLYGVYSANDGFLALLPPGTYSSDGINASCNLTIGPNCAVSN
jgi:hypothetical protein